MSDDTKMTLVAHDTNLQPSTLQELASLAKHAADSKFFKDVFSSSQALMLMMAGRDLGLSYTQSLRAFHVIEGRPTLSADGMVAVCLGRRDVCKFFRTVETDDRHATVETHRIGDPEPRRASFTFEEAQRAGLVKDRGNWFKYPGRMCLARARAFLAREVYPDLLMGLYDPDEIEAREERHQAPAIRIVESQRRTAPASVAYAEADSSALDAQHAIDDGPPHDADGVVIEDAAHQIEAIVESIEQAADMQALHAIAGSVSRMQDAGDLSPEATEGIRSAWQDRKKALVAQAKGAA